MVKALKSLSKSVLFLLIFVICLPILLLIFLAIIQSCGNRNSYDKYEKNMQIAASKYLKNKDLLSSVSEDGELITLDALVTNGYIKSPEKVLKDSSCEGFVTARKNGNVEQLNLSGDIQYNVYLSCDKYKTNTLISNVMKDLTSSESGLYDDGINYVYKGDNVNNYVKFYGQLYRIMSVDKQGIIKLIRKNKQSFARAWDNKYNVDAEYSSGKSIYKDSLILKQLLDDYMNDRIISENARKHIVSYDACVGKRDKEDYAISYDLDCSEILTNQVISLVNISDFARASLDPDCKSISDMSCENYNYLSDTISSTWTMNSISNNSYEVYYLNSGVPRLASASQYKSYGIVIYVDGNEVVTDGSGTIKSPYVIGS